MTNFQSEYEKLNIQQKKAVDEIDGAVLVVAGPGTGKTQILSMRVANILRKTDTDPQNILCLTFTDKASLNMKQRLLKLVGSDANKIVVKTFHSFASELMNFYPTYFWSGAKLSSVPDAVQNEIIISILSQLSLNDPLALKFAGQFTSVNDVKTGLKLVKEAGLTPDKLEAIVSLNLAYIDDIEPFMVDALSNQLSFKKLNQLKEKISKLPPQGIENSYSPLISLSDVIKKDLDFAISKDELINKTTNTSKWKHNLIQKNKLNIKGMHREKERNRWWLSLSNVYKQYRNELHQRGYYDYADMLVEVITVIEQNPQLQAEIQDQFLYVLVDEFQDSNSAQMKLAHLVADHHTNLNNPNLMVVGDDDQSIFKFNGAELSNMLTFQNNYPKAKLVVLTDNYRSSQAILDTATKVISQASDRLVLRNSSINKTLKALNSPKAKSNIVHKIYLNKIHQDVSLAHEITKLWQKAKPEIAILARNNQSLKQIAYLLNENNIPIIYTDQNNILEQPLIKLVHSIASVILAISEGDERNANYLLSHILRHPAWQIDPKLLWNIAIKSRNDNWLNCMSQSNDPRLLDIANWLFELVSISAYEPLPITIETILGLRPAKKYTSPIIEFIKNNEKIDTHYLQNIASIQLLLSVVNEFARGTSAKLKDFVNFINLSNNSNIVIPYSSPFILGKSAVELLTAHKAKGLEFDKVYIIDALENNWKPKNKSKTTVMNLPLQPAFDDNDDYLRLMFVALTRARQDITISSYKFDEKNQEVLSTPIVNNIIPTIEIEAPNEATVLEIYETTFPWPDINSTDQKQLLEPQLNELKLSVTALLDFLDITHGGPLNYKENHLLKLPFAQSTNMAFGTAIHSALEYAQILTNKNEYNLSKIISKFESVLAQQNLTKNDLKKFSEHGRLVLENLLKSNNFILYTNSYAEYSIKDVLVGEANLFGKLDRVDFNNKTLTIIDYKTGSPLANFETKDKTKSVKAWRHKMQLTFYCLLAQKHPKFEKYKNFIGKMMYVEATNPKDLSLEYQPSAEEIVELENLIQIVWSKIMNLDFPNIEQYSKDMTGIKNFINDLILLKIA